MYVWTSYIRLLQAPLLNHVALCAFANCPGLTKHCSHIHELKKKSRLEVLACEAEHFIVGGPGPCRTSLVGTSWAKRQLKLLRLMLFSGRAAGSSIQFWGLAL